MAPLLLVTGDSDSIVPACNHAEPLAARLPRARLVMLKGAGHALYHSRAGEVANLIAEFVEATQTRMN